MPTRNFFPRQRRDGNLFRCFTILTVFAVLFGAAGIATAQPGTLDPTFVTSVTNFPVDGIAFQPDGRILVQLRFAIPRLEPNGALDTNFDAGLPDGSRPYFVETLPDGKVVVGGDFQTLHGVTRSCLARLNADGSLDGGFVPQFYTYSPVSIAKAQPDGKVLVAGSYRIGTNNAMLPNLFRVNSDGSIDTSFAVVTNIARRLALQPDGKILIAEEVPPPPNTHGANIIYRLNPDGTRDTNFATATIGGWVNTMFAQSNSIIIGGYLYRVNGLSEGCVARLGMDGQLDTSFHCDVSPGSSGVGIAIPQPDGKVLIGGQFSIIGSTIQNLVRLNSNGSLDTTYASTGAGNFVNTLKAQPDGQVIIGGDYTTINGVGVYRLARLNGDSDGPGKVVFDPATAEVFEDSGAISLTARRIWGNQGDLAVTYETRSGTAIAGADFKAQSGALVFHAGETTKTLTVEINNDAHIEDVESFQVWLNGPAVGNQDHCTVTIIDDDGPASLDSSFSVKSGTLDSLVRGITVQPDGRILIGGPFQQVANTLRIGIARLNDLGVLDSTFDPGAGLVFNGSPGYMNLARIQNDGKIVIAGIFNQINGTNRNYVARLNSSGSLDPSFDDGTGPIGGGGVVGDVRGMELATDGKVIVGGYFTTYNGSTRYGLARLNTNGAVDLSYQPTGPNTVVPFGLQPDGKIVFSGQWSSYCTRVNANGSVDVSTFASANNLIRQVASLPDGKTMIGGHFVTVNGVARRCLARLLVDGSVDQTFTPDLDLFLGASSPPLVYRFAMQTDGSVLAVLKAYVTPKADYLVRLKPNGALDRNFEPVRFNIPIGDNELIWAITLQSDGKILVGGEFQTVNGLNHPYLVRLMGGERPGTRKIVVSSLSVTGNQREVNLEVSPAKPFVLQSSGNLTDWSDLSTNTVLTSTFKIIDSRLSGTTPVYYRVKQLIP